jgi:DNA helicase IV
MSNPDLGAEQAYIDFAYERLEAMREAAAHLRDYVITEGSGGTHQARYERDVFVYRGLERIDQLEIGDNSLVFGRIDRDPPPGADTVTLYIGRRAVAGPDQEPIVVDWRAPASEAFYRATGRHPLGLHRRRHFDCDGPVLNGIEDEYFSDGGEGDGDLGLAGPGALLRALERSRTGYMRDIVATVQAEQDEIIRADVQGVLAVQGGPGTGKTAVALHRAAYLLFTYRRQLGRQGILVVGPSPLFLRYISHVLPALGESGADLATPNGLHGGVRPKAQDTRAVARLKADLRMVDLVAKAVRDRERPLRSDLVVQAGPYKLTLRAQQTASLIGDVRRRGGTHNARRRTVEQLVIRRLWNEYLQVSAREGHAKTLTRKEVVAEVGDDEAMAAALDRMWPVLTPEELLHDLYGAMPLLRLAAQGLLSRTEYESLHRPRSATLRDVEWTAGDIPLLDEALALLGHHRRRGDDEEDEDLFPAYGHIVVDEVQDLSPLQLRMLARRSLTGSMTIVGDVAQATGQWAPAWDDILAHLPIHRGLRRSELSVNYRTPQEVMDVAARVLAEAAPELSPSRSVRATGEHPRFLRVDEPGAEVARVVIDERVDLGGGTVAVVCPPTLAPALAGGLDDAGIAFGDPDHQGLDEQVTLVPVDLVKGLEFDVVVVVEPARIVRESPQGLRALYVALTRSTRRLIVVHAEELPSCLR